jgi:hypothetical protein
MLKNGKNGRKRQRGIFAIEGEWMSDLRGGLSFRPLLEIIRSLRRSPIVHRDAATREELFYYLRKWTQKRYARYSILYLGFHGQEESILIGDARERDCQVRLDELAEELEGKCEKKIIYFGSCSTVGIDERRLQTFLQRTRALAICGYRENVDMVRSAAFELLLLNTLLDNALTLTGATAMRRRILTEERHLVRELSFRMVVRKNL